MTDIGGNFPALGWNAHQVFGLTTDVQQFAHTIPSPVDIHTLCTQTSQSLEEAGPLPSFQGYDIIH